jgi:hypothetical protein
VTSQVLLTAPPIQARYTLLLTRNESDVVAAQRLRHRVFAGEMRARLSGPVPGLDVDDLDRHCDAHPSSGPSLGRDGITTLDEKAIDGFVGRCAQRARTAAEWWQPGACPTTCRCRLRAAPNAALEQLVPTRTTGGRCRQ